MPPSRTPIASERIGGSTRDASSEMARIIPTFWTAGPSALAKNRPCAFSAPAASAASPTKTTYGNITRVRSTASPPRAGSSAMPGAIAVTSHGAVAMPSSAVTPRATSASAKTARSIRRTSGRDCVTKYSEKTGIIAVDKAPSARRRRRMFGIRNATKNASVTGPAPNTSATTMSRTKPTTRLTSVALPMDPSARTTCRSVELTLNSSHRSGMMQRVRRAAPPASRGPGAARTSRRKERSGGEYEVGDQAHPSKRATAAPQPDRAVPGAYPDQGGARCGRPGRAPGDPRSDPRSRQGHVEGRASREHRVPQEVRARSPTRRSPLIRGRELVEQL